MRKLTLHSAHAVDVLHQFHCDLLLQFGVDGAGNADDAMAAVDLELATVE